MRLEQKLKNKKVSIGNFEMLKEGYYANRLKAQEVQARHISMPASLCNEN